MIALGWIGVSGVSMTTGVDAGLGRKKSGDVRVLGKTNRLVVGRAGGAAGVGGEGRFLADAWHLGNRWRRL